MSKWILEVIYSWCEIKGWCINWKQLFNFFFFLVFCWISGISDMFLLPLYSANSEQHLWSISCLKLLEIRKSPALLCILLALIMVLVIWSIERSKGNQCYRSNSLTHSFHLDLCYVNGPPPTWGLHRCRVLKLEHQEQTCGDITTIVSKGKKNLGKKIAELGWRSSHIRPGFIRDFRICRDTDMIWNTFWFISLAIA